MIYAAAGFCGVGRHRSQGFNVRRSLRSEQLLESLPDDAHGDWLSVAYEPIWAIGTGLTPSGADIAAINRVVRQTCVARCDPAGLAIRLLHDGSVGPANAKTILATRDVDGVPVGGASLAPDTFLPIIAGATCEPATAAG